MNTDEHRSPKACAGTEPLAKSEPTEGVFICVHLCLSVVKHLQLPLLGSPGTELVFDFIKAEADLLLPPVFFAGQQLE